MSTVVYITAGTMTDLSQDSSITTVFDGMIAAQDAEGESITWDTLTYRIAVGQLAFAGNARVAVLDLDIADGMDVVRLTSYVNGHTNTVPELRAEMGR